MADIAMLVAEEYERRIKLARKTGHGSGPPSTETGLGSLFARAPIHSVKWIPKTRLKDFEEAFNPANPVTIAALDGLFSA